jgi:hypothetical protein
MVGERNRATCMGCQTVVDTSTKATHRLIEAWVSCQSAALNHTYVIGRELEQFLCVECYGKMRRGIPLGQESMF